MLTFHQVAVFLGAALLLAIMPGPGLLYVAGRTLSGGRSEGLASSFGTALGGTVHVAAASVGLSALILASAHAYAAMKILGAVYLIWLGFKTIRTARREAADAMRALSVMAPEGVRKAFWDGAAVEATNPKTAAFFLAFLPQFVVVAQGHVALQFMCLGALSVILNTLADILVAIGAAALRGALLGTPRLLQRFREVSGGLCIALGCGMLLGRRTAS